MTRHLFRCTVILALAAGLTGCSKQKETDEKLAELQKQLEATRQELAAKSAEAGNAIAMYNLGLSFEHGLGLTKDITEANRWYRLAAEADLAAAMTALPHPPKTSQNVPKTSANTRRPMGMIRQAYRSGEPLERCETPRTTREV